MPDRLDVLKTYKLYINGAFPRSESGRTVEVHGRDGATLAHTCRASRKDLRDAVVAARVVSEKWANSTAYLRGQILYRMAEMMEGKRGEFVEAIVEVQAGGAARKSNPSPQPSPKGGGRGRAAVRKGAVKRTTARGAAGLRGASAAMLRKNAEREVEASIDRLVSFAGWSDKFSQVLGCHNHVTGPYYNFTIAEPTGVVAIVAPDEPSLLGLVSLVAPVVSAGCVVVALGSEANPIPTSILGEVCATSDVPAGVVNLLTGLREELIPFIAEHRDIDAVHAADLPAEQATRLRLGSAENLKRVTARTVGGAAWFDAEACQSPWWIEPFVEMKTIWHPSAT